MINKKEKKITTSELLKSINRSFDKMEAKMVTKEEVKTIVQKEIEGVKNLIGGIEKRIDDFAENKVSRVEHKELKSRVDFIEKKLEIK